MNPFAYHTPETQEEALALLHEHGDNAKLMAGGTALVIMMKQRLVVPETLISLHRLRGLTAVQETDGVLQLGALGRDPLRIRVPDAEVSRRDRHSGRGAL
jgi:carbon-monoxide dehydrogenase medium subunit